MSEIYALFVLEGHLDPAYVLDHMQLYEVRTLLQNWHMIHKESWEQTRWQTCFIMNMLAKDKIKMTDLISFPWDKETQQDEPKALDDNRMNALIERAKQFEKNFNND